MGTHTIRIETPLEGAELHEQLCKAIHELDIKALNRLGWHVSDITLETAHVTLEEPTTEAAIEYLLESYDIVSESRIPITHAFRCILAAHGAAK